MKKALFIIAIFTMISCSVDEQIVKNDRQYKTFGDTTRNFKLSLLEADYGFDGWEQGLGIKIPPYDWGYKVSYSPITFNSTVFDTTFTYFCPFLMCRQAISFLSCYNYCCWC